MVLFPTRILTNLSRDHSWSVLSFLVFAFNLVSLHSAFQEWTLTILWQSLLQYHKISMLFFIQDSFLRNFRGDSERAENVKQRVRKDFIFLSLESWGTMYGLASGGCWVLSKMKLNNATYIPALLRRAYELLLFLAQDPDDLVASAPYISPCVKACWGSGRCDVTQSAEWQDVAWFQMWLSRCWSGDESWRVSCKWLSATSFIHRLISRWGNSYMYE